MWSLKKFVISTPHSVKLMLLLLLIMIYFGLAAWFLQNYFLFNVTICLGIAMLPYILTIRRGEFSYRFLIPLTFFVATSLFLPAQSFIFLTCMFGLLFLIESCFGKVNNSFFILLLLLSPVFNFFNNSIGFPIRIWLSEMSGNIFHLVGNEVSVSGNMMNMDGIEFSVDSACAGLNMMTVSFLIALFILSYYQRKTGNQLSVFRVSLFLLVTFILNILCNLFRILILVYFKVMPDNPWHEIIGSVCLVIYVIIPLIAISKFQFDGKQVAKQILNFDEKFLYRKLVLNCVILAIICFAATRNSSINNTVLQNNYYIDGYDRTVLKNGVVKFEDNKSLIYLKPMKFYNAEHNPMICWSGSGYEFTKIDKEFVGGVEIYTGLLTKGPDVIHTAWWFGNGSYTTISQLNWRWKEFNGQHDFCLVNVNASNREQLIIEAKNLLNKSSFKNTNQHASFN